MKAIIDFLVANKDAVAIVLSSGAFFFSLLSFWLNRRYTRRTFTQTQYPQINIERFQAAQAGVEIVFKKITKYKAVDPRLTIFLCQGGRRLKKILRISDLPPDQIAVFRIAELNKLIEAFSPRKIRHVVSKPTVFGDSIDAILKVDNNVKLDFFSSVKLEYGAPLLASEKLSVNWHGLISPSDADHQGYIMHWKVTNLKPTCRNWLKRFRWKSETIA